MDGRMLRGAAGAGQPAAVAGEAPSIAPGAATPAVSGSAATPAVAGEAHPRERGRRGHRVLVGGSVPAGGRSEAGDTRERILDVALDLFLEQGYDGTSLREIAERLGVTKAALYYHFPSKEDIFRALHMRVHALLSKALERLPARTASRAEWAGFFDGMIDEVVASSKLFLMHQRNAAAVSEWHSKDHGGGGQDPDQVFVGVIRDRSLPLEDRVRLIGAMALIAGGASLLLEPNQVPPDPAALTGALRAAVHDLLRPDPTSA